MDTTNIKADISIKELPARHLAYAENVGPYMGDQALFGRLFNQVMAWLQPKGLMGPGMEAISVYHDNPEEVPPEKHRISVGFTVPEGTEAEGEIGIMELPAGKYLVGSFEIAADGYPQAWGAMQQYIQENDLKPGGKFMYESYKNDPGQHPEGKHLVDICVEL